MSYYDNVKDSIQDKEGSGSSGSSTPNFDTLKKAAEETSNEDEEEKGDDTEIEVLEEGLRREPSGKNQQTSKGAAGSKGQDRQKQQERSAGQEKTGLEAREAGQGQPSQSGSIEASGLEEKLDRIIEQNERMIEILESFGS
ncbi:MAG: hypothetical protein ABEJ03_01540 [Candidatus Nanohaloarchaea archaeon]